MQHPNKVDRRPLNRKLVLWLSLALLALAVALILLLPAIRQRFPAESVAVPDVVLPFRTLGEYAEDALDSVTITHADGQSYTLRYQNGALWLERDGGLTAISESSSDTLIKAVTQISVENIVTEDASEVAEHLEDMGLAPPRAVAHVRYTSGDTVTLELGSEVPETTYSYYRWSGDNGIYMCDVGISDALLMTANRLLPVEQPVMTRLLIDRLALTTADGQVIGMAFTSDAAGNAYGRLTSPYDYPMSADATDAMLTALTNFRLGTPEGDLTDDSYAEYGFDSPLLVLEAHSREGARSVVSDDGQLLAETAPEMTLRFTLGREEGDYYYTCLYEGARYNVSRFLCEALVNAKTAQLITRTPADLGDVYISAIAVQTGTGVLDAHAARVERVLPNNQLETDVDGNVLYDTTVTINGETATQEQYDALVSRLKSMKVSGSLPDGWSPDGKTPRWKLTLTTEGGQTRQITAYTLDAFSDALVVDGSALHYAYIEALNTALAEWMP